MNEKTYSYSPPFNQTLSHSHKQKDVKKNILEILIASMSVMNKEAHHLEQSQIASTHVVKIDLDILPAHFSVVLIDEVKAL